MPEEEFLKWSEFKKIDPDKIIASVKIKGSHVWSFDPRLSSILFQYMDVSFYDKEGISLLFEETLKIKDHEISKIKQDLALKHESYLTEIQRWVDYANKLIERNNSRMFSKKISKIHSRGFGQYIWEEI
jgi:hypothetical protein